MGTRAEINAAAAICSSLQHQLHLADLRQEGVRYMQLNEKLSKTNEELANMNWISTHDLKEPLRKIQMYASVILEKDGQHIPPNVKSTIVRMQTSASRMQVLIDDLMSYSRVVGEDVKFDEVNLADILTQVQTELKETIEERNM